MEDIENIDYFLASDGENFPAYRVEIPDTRPLIQMDSLIQTDDMMQNELSSDFNYNLSSSSISQSKPSKIKNRFTLILNEFYTINKSIPTKKHPKKEFFNAFIIRAIKRAFRCILQHKIPVKTCISIDQLNIVQANLWNELGSIYRENPNLIIDISKTENGPETDGKPKRKNKVKDPEEEENKSYNNKFCKSFFSQDVLVRKAFWLVIGIIFSDDEINKKIDRFKFTCCENLDHNQLCLNKWSQLKQYFARQYFEDLDVEV